MKGLHRVATVGGAIVLAGCSSTQSALNPHAPEAARILYLFIIFVAVSAVVWVGVVFVTGQGLLRRKEERAGPLNLNEVTERRFWTITLCLAVATGGTVIALSVL